MSQFCWRLGENLGFGQNVEYLGNQRFYWKSEKKPVWRIMRGIDCRGHFQNRTVGFRRKTKTKWHDKSSFSLISRQLAFLLKIGKKTRLGIFERNRLPWSFSKSYGWLSQEKQNKHSRLSQNISETDTSTTICSPQIDAPGNKALGDTFGFSNNPLYPEKSVPTCRSKKWKFWRWRTILPFFLGYMGIYRILSIYPRYRDVGVNERYMRGIWAWCDTRT